MKEKKTRRSPACLVHQTSRRKPMQGGKEGGFGDAGTEGLMDGGRVGWRECLMSGRRKSVMKGCRGGEDAERSSQEGIYCNYYT